MRYGILGSAQVHRNDGTPVALGGARLRALLTALAQRPGRVCQTDGLIDAVWQDDPPADAPGALQALVGRLRRALEHDAVGSAYGGYRLVATWDEVDAYRFQRLADEGAEQVAAGAPGKAVDLLDEALELWRGPALADLPGATAAATRLETARDAAQRTRLTALLALGRTAEVLPALTALCADHPLDESLHALRLRALRAAGRTAEALTGYEEIRLRIADRLGADPGPELRELHAELLGGGPVTALTPAADPARSPESRPPSGQPATSSTPPEPGPPTGNLPAPLTSFVGREGDLASLREHVASRRLVTLLGPGGAGKTRLSQELAESVRAAWPSGVWLVELAPVDDPHDVVPAVLTALGARETVLLGTAKEHLRYPADPGPEDTLGQLVEFCAGRRMVLVLDNCEHLLEAAARLVEQLLSRCPGVTVVATSREPLGVPGETVYPVDPLPTPVALRLLAERAAAAGAGPEVTEDRVACQEICRRLDGLPLAIELAAARLRALSPRQIADRLDDRFRLLGNGSRTVLPRQQTLRAVVDWSWELLSPTERAVLRRLSVFAGGCDLAAAEWVCGDPPDGVGTDGVAPDGDRAAAHPAGEAATSGDETERVDPRDVAALLGSLVDKSLTVATPGAGGEMRYRLLETVAEYAGERLEEAGERTRVTGRHLVAYREVARTTEPSLRGPGQTDALERLETEHENIRTALRHAIALGDEQEVLCLVLSMAWFWQLRDHHGEAGTFARAAVALGPGPLPHLSEPAPALYAAPVDAPPPMPEPLLQEARRCVRLVMLASVGEDYPALTESPEKVSELRALASAYHPDLPQACRLPGMAWFFTTLVLGDFHELPDILRRSVRTCRRLGYTWELAFLLGFKGKMEEDDQARCDPDDTDNGESLRLFIELGDSWGAAQALAGRGELREQRGEYGLAAEDFHAAIDYAKRIGARTHVLSLRTRLAGVALELGRVEEGERTLREILAETENTTGEAPVFALMYLCRLCGMTGRGAEAREHLGAMARQMPRGPAMFLGLVESMYGWLDVLEGRPDAALPRLRIALTAAQQEMAQAVAPQLLASHLNCAARAHVALGNPERGVRLLGAYDAYRAARCGHPSAYDRADRAVSERTARELLGDTAYESGYAAGQRLTVAEAASLV